MDIQPVIEFVVRAHAGQTRKGERNGVALPYITHVFEVYKMVWRCGALDDITGPAALGHDLLEDCPQVTPEILRERFGEKVASVIEDLTFKPHANDHRSSSEQKALHLLELRHKSIEAVVIKPCDRYVNVVDFLRDDPKYAGEYLKKGEAIFEAVAARSREIDERFGADVGDRLLALKTELESRINRE